MRLLVLLCVFLGLIIGLMTALERTHAQSIPSSRAEISLSFAPVVAKTAPAVVNVYGQRTEQRPRHPFFEDPLFQQFFGQGAPQRERARQSVGSGVIVHASGLVVTNHHVIEDMTEIKVALADKREFAAEVLIRDPRSDLAVLKLTGGPAAFPFIQLGNSDSLAVGDLVLAIGNPFGVGQTVTQGIVSALARTQVGVSDYQFFVQTDAAINPGNSGGALVDMKGQLVGVNTAIYSRSGGSHGIGFAIPTTMVRVLMESALSGAKTVQRPWLGARLQTLTPDVAESLRLERPQGALVASVIEGSPADKAGLKTGDLLVAVDGQSVEDPDAFGFRLGTRPVGGTASLSVIRRGNKLELPLGLTPAPEMPKRDSVRLKGNHPLAGGVFVNLSPAVAEELGQEHTARGVVVFDVTSPSVAQQIGLRKGDRVISVNGEDVTDTRLLERLMMERPRIWRLTFERDGQRFTQIFGGSR